MLRIQQYAQDCAQYINMALLYWGSKTVNVPNKQ